MPRTVWDQYFCSLAWKYATSSRPRCLRISYSTSSSVGNLLCLSTVTIALFAAKKKTCLQNIIAVFTKHIRNC